MHHSIHCKICRFKFSGGGKKSCMVMQFCLNCTFPVKNNRLIRKQGLIDSLQYLVRE